MANGEDTSFEDPALKQALKRVIAAERAPEALRARIARTLAQPQGMPRWRLVHPGRLAGLAAAAVVLIAFGVFAYFHWFTPGRPGPLPQSLALAIVERHDECAAAPDHHAVDKPGESFSLIGQAIEQQLHRPILAADLRRDGWTFSGAALCPVEGRPCGHLLFKQGNQSLSILSLPASLLEHAREGARYETMLDNHAIVVQAHDGSLFCVCGYSPAGKLTVPEMAHLLSEHAAETVTAMPNQKRVTLADAGVTVEKN